MSFWEGKRVTITGGTGFLGRHVNAELESLPLSCIYNVCHEDYDLRLQTDVRQLLQEHPADVIIHLAARVGGIGYNRENPATLFYDNIMMGALLLEEARLTGVKKIVILGTVCAYPKWTPAPFKEDDLWQGYPEETNAPYGIAKKALLIQCQAFRQQYGLNAIYLLPVNLYGPGDNFSPQSSHVIPALIKKFVDATKQGQSTVTCWGDGSATREFLYVKDCARAIRLACEHYNDREPVNIGSSEEISIRDLAAMIAELCNFDGKIVWDKTMPDGQPRRLLDTSRAAALFHFKCEKSLKDGLQETLKWYQSHST